MKSTPMAIIGKTAWIITAIAAINTGLRPFEFDLFASDWMINNMPQLITPLHYLVGIAGVISLLMFFGVIAMGCCDCTGKSGVYGKACASCGSMSGCNCRM